jgi:hypothetical protein
LPATSREGRKATSVGRGLEHVRQQFTDEEVELPTAAVAAINCWNRHQAEGREAAALAH